MRKPMRRHVAVTIAVLIVAQLHTSPSTAAPDSPDPGDHPVQPTPNYGSIIPGYPNDSIVPTDAPILIPGSGGVTDNGGATYSTALSTPEGPLGAAPHLSVDYGGTANGRLGVGMGLAGLSVITPCGQSVASEGRADGIDFDTSDSYCLDGQKLVQVKWLGDQVIYHTESETFQRVVARYDDKHKAQPASFTVQRRDGQTSTYEPRNAIRVKGVDEKNPVAAQEKQVAPVYPIVRSVDRTGVNKIVYSYETDATTAQNEFSYRISEIGYSLSSNDTPRRRVRFLYEEPRPDPMVTYVSGVPIVNRSRLKTIEMYAPDPTTTKLVWSYRLQYRAKVSSATSRTLLDSIQLCDRAGVCSWKKQFQWTENSSAADSTLNDVEFNDVSLSRDAPGWIDYQLHKQANFLAPSDVRLMVFDVDGDGIDDVVYRTQPTRYTPKENYVKVGGIPQADPTLEYTAGKIYLRRSKEGAPLSQRTDLSAAFEPQGGSQWNAHLGKSRVADFNFDGVPDLMLARTRVDQVGWWHAPCDPAMPCGPGEDIPDRHKWFYGYTYLTGYPWPTNLSGAPQETTIWGPVFRGKSFGEGFDYRLFTPPFQRALADLDGDGRVDQIDAFQLGDNQPLSLLPELVHEDWSSFKSYHSPQPFRYDLANDNGKDLAQHEIDGVFPHNWTCNNGNLMVSDFDGDGREDILAGTDNAVDSNMSVPDTGLYKQMHLADSDGLGAVGPPAADETSKLWGGGCKQYLPDVVFGDFNGDGLQDALYPPQSLNGNPDAKVRWNLGNGFGPLTSMAVGDPANPDPTLTALMHQAVPTGKDGDPVPWDRGTRTADVNEDGRTDIVAFRLQPTNCIDANANFGCSTYKTVVVVYLSLGDHFEGQILKTWDDGGVSLAEGFTTAQLGDVTGDGAVDIVHVVGGKIHVLETPWRQPADRLSSVTDMGSPNPTELFTYTRQWWGDGPQPSGKPCPYPTACPHRGFTVVREETSFTGTQPSWHAMYRHRVHKYADPRSDQTGRGSLGFAAHHIWDVELGQEKIVEFDNATIVDPKESSPGGVFYPFTTTPKRVWTITPLAPLPTAAQIGASPPTKMPGLDDQTTSAGGGLHLVDARISIGTYKSEYKWDPSFGGRVISVLPESFESKELETAMALEMNSKETPSYIWWNLDAMYSWLDAKVPLRQRSGTFSYDEFGDLKEQKVRTKDGVTELASYDYENRVDDWANPSSNSSTPRWILGLQTKAETSTEEPADGTSKLTPVHVVRATYDPNDPRALVDTVTDSAYFSPCYSPVTIPQPCEEKTTTTTFKHDSRGNIKSFTTVGAKEPLARSGSFSWDSEGVYQTQVKDGLGFTETTLRHPALGVPILEQDLNGVTTKLKYDGFGRFRARSRPGSPQLVRYYKPFAENQRRGMVAGDASLDGGKALVTYDELGRVIETRQLGFDGSWNVATQQYNEVGLLSEVHRPGVSAPSPASSVFTYDRLRRPLVAVGPDNAKTTYEPKMFSTTTWDPEGHQSYLDRDLDDRVIETGHRIKDGQKTKKYGVVKLDYFSGDLVEHVTDAKKNVTTNEYDAFGRRIVLHDPDTGTSNSSYNGFGELLSETSANGDVYTHQYDVLGRVVHATGPDGDTTNVYDAGPFAGRRLVSTSGPDGVSTAYKYDSLGRKTQLAETIGGDTYRVDRLYDAYGRMTRLLYPTVAGHNRFTLGYRYNGRGYLEAIDDMTNACPVDPQLNNPRIPVLCSTDELWRAEKRNEDLALTEAVLGNGQHVGQVYTPATGRLQQISVPSLGQATSYGYYDDGNVKSRFDAKTHRTETFQYDDLHRLTDWTLQSGWSEKAGRFGKTSGTSYSYDELGDLEEVKADGATAFKADYGAQGKPHALTSSNVDGAFTYDTGGRQKTGAGRKVAWSQYNQPRTISSSLGTATKFEYDSTGTRARKTITTAPQETTIYVGGLYERRIKGADEIHTFFVGGDSGVVAQVEYYSGGGTSRRYIVSDHLGSTTLVLDDNGAVLEHSYYDPFGGRVDDNGAPTADPDPTTTTGFTGHEHDGAGLINMRGRIYDRDQYRFLTPDPIVAAPLFGQSYNPYSYVLNNPLRYTDPSGFNPKDDPSADAGKEYKEPTPPPIELGEIIVVGCVNGGEPPDCGKEAKDTGAAIKADSSSGSSQQSTGGDSGGTKLPAAAIAKGMATGARIATTTGMGATRMQGIVDALEKSTTFAGSKTYAMVQGADVSGAVYMVGANASGIPKFQQQVQLAVSDLALTAGPGFAGHGAMRSGIHAEPGLLKAARDQGLSVEKLVASKAVCPACQGVTEGVEVLTPTVEQNGGKVTRQLLGGADELMHEAGRFATLRSTARALTPALEVVGGALSVASFVSNLSEGNFLDAAFGDATGIGGTVVTVTGGNPYTAAGLTAFSAGYGLTTFALETFLDPYLNRPHMEDVIDP